MIRKKFFFTIVIAMVLFCSVDAPSAQEYGFHDGEYTYSIRNYIGTFAGNQIYSTFVQGVDANATGLIFYDPVYSSLKITVFENQELRGWTLEGQWTGGGDTFSLARNDGTTGQRLLNLFFFIIE